MTGLEVVLTDGAVVQLDRDAPGYDLLGAFVGSEGTLGVATKITLRVIPVPESVRTLVAFFEDTGAAGEAVTEIVSAGIVPGRDRDDGPASRSRPPSRPPAPATGSTPARRCWSSSTAPTRSARRAWSR